jgi:hypothetical protein
METEKKQWQNKFCTITKLKKSYLLESKTDKYQPKEFAFLHDLLIKGGFDINEKFNINHFFANQLKTKNMETIKESIKDLKEVETLLYKAYILQNSAKCILSKHFTIDNHLEFEKNEFYKIYKINTSTNLYECELQTQNLIDKINNENINL